MRCILEKNLAGWEVMEVFAGGVNESDAVFLVSVTIVRPCFFEYADTLLA